MKNAQRIIFVIDNSKNIVDCDGGDSDNDTDDLIEDAKNFIELGRRLDNLADILIVIINK